MTALFGKSRGFLLRGGGPQGLRRPRFSFFRFTCQTARKPWRSPFPIAREAVEAQIFRPKSDDWSPYQGGASQARHRAGKRGGAPLWRLYMGQPFTLSTQNPGKYHGAFGLVERCALPWSPGAAKASAPHSRHIPPALFASGKGQ